MTGRILDLDNVILENDDDLDDLNLGFYGVPRRIYESADHVHTYDEQTFFRRFRVTKPRALFILTLIEAELEYPYDLLSSFLYRRFCRGAFGISLEDRIGLARLGPRFIKMPDTPEEIAATQYDFYQVARFPRVIRAVDGSQIKIKSPGGDDAELFRNRKGYFSINIQTVSNAKLKILDSVVRWPGSAHDVIMFNSSRIRQRFENDKFPNTNLLGDGGYNLRPYFMTPLLNPTTRAGELYNKSHIRTSNTVERQLGVWKMRFPILAYGYRLKLDTSIAVIVATGVLHSICIDNNDTEPPPPEDLELLQDIMQQDEVPNIPLQIEANNNGIMHIQRNLINNYFAYIEE